MEIFKHPQNETKLYEEASVSIMQHLINNDRLNASLVPPLPTSHPILKPSPLLSCLESNQFGPFSIRSTVRWTGTALCVGSNINPSSFVMALCLDVATDLSLISLAS